MDTVHPNEINGINLNNYYAKQRSYNSVVYVHKKLLDQKKEKKIEKEKKKKEVKDKKDKAKGKNVKCDKGQQYNNEVTNEFNAEMLGLSGVLGQTLQFAKTLVPVVIPPSGIVSPVYYTIKATKKSKKKPRTDISGQTYKKERCKKIVETFRNEKGSQKESISEVKETISYTSHSDTLDELQMNPSLCCTFSDVSEHKQVKKEVVHADRKREKFKHDQKVVTSESFEALATEFLNNSGDTKIKIHLMNETEKNLLAENIRVPLLNAIRDSILEINSQSRNTEITTVHKYVKCNTQKLDSIMDKLACIENKLDNYIVKEETKSIPKPKSPKVQIAVAAKASTLEKLGEDLLELDGESSGDEYYQGPTLSARKRKAQERRAVVQIEAIDNPEKREVLGGGEDAEIGNTDGSQLVRPDRPNRIPARFCWTDARKNNIA